MRTPFVRPSYFIWVIVPLVLYGAFLLWGLPHGIFSYDFRGTFADRAGRWYTRCTFIGPYGDFTTTPTDGRCAWVIFRKKEDAQ